MSLRLMCLTAHPDDEAGAFGAALLKAVDHGIETSVLCLTEGAAGSYREQGQTNEELAALRRGEFAEAATALRVGGTELLQYPDGDLWRQPFLELVETLVHGLRTVKPHIVLTFGGEGGVNLHPDHTMVSLAATAAFHWAGRSMFPKQFPELAPWAPQKLYYASASFLAVKEQEVKRTGTRVPPSLTYRLTPEERRQKYAAFAKHSSQRGVLERVEAQFSEEMNWEHYLLVAARNPLASETDLWDGVIED